MRSVKFATETLMYCRIVSYGITKMAIEQTTILIIFCMLVVDAIGKFTT